MKDVAFKAGTHNLAYVEQFYVDYLRDAETVPTAWREYFTKIQDGEDQTIRLAPRFKPRTIFNPVVSRESGLEVAPSIEPTAQPGLGSRLYRLVTNYRTRGHLIAKIDPLNGARASPPELELDFYGFADSELDSVAHLATLPPDRPHTVREIYQRLRNTYCRSIGAQFMHIDDLLAREWLQRRMESCENHLVISREQQLRILTRLTDAVIFEEFLRKKFIGAKTFSLEGCETLLPLLDLAIERAAQQGVNDIVIGMAHRGRLNVLAHIVGKSPCDIFREFSDADSELWEGSGDVKHHLGYSCEWETAGGQKIHLSLCFNPSHLEFVNPVAQGRVRARQDRFGDRERRRTLALLIHGDAAFAGEGVVQESLNLAKLAGYNVGGVLHVVINNQIGFTTPPNEDRSATYATDVALLLQSPIFHVNGEDPEAVAQSVQLAMDFRQKFQGDVFIDMYGYRRLGHNETDEPSFTQPLLYRTIEKRPNVREGYLEHMLELDEITRKEADELALDRRDKLERDLAAARKDECPAPPDRNRIWRDYVGGREPADEPDTGVPVERLTTLLRQLTEIPEGFHLHPKLERFLQNRRDMAEGKHPLDWSTAEALALAGLAENGVRIRFTGQDSARGTFSQRHAVLCDFQDGSPYVPLRHVAENQAPVEILNSSLCETGTLGFEYGYSLDCPDGLVLWEAQFGDFVNAAQVILDQFITSAEDKWRRLSGLVMLLPHGFEGMGPEHSSARIERFLTLCAEDNIQIAQPTTPAQYFHLLRRQMLRKWRKPLVVFTPKSLLRHPKAVSSLEDCAHGHFERVLPDDVKSAKRTLLCTGKIYYELAAYREEHQRTDVGIVRLEQLYPLREELLQEALKTNGNAQIFWVQEEPSNMGAWRYLHEQLGDRFDLKLVSRTPSASPATGSAGAHKLEQAKLIQTAFGEKGEHVH